MKELFLVAVLALSGCSFSLEKLECYGPDNCIETKQQMLRNLVHHKA